MSRLLALLRLRRHPGIPDARDAEALSAGWVPPQPDLRVTAPPTRRAIEDVEALVARFYFHQQC